MREIGLGRAMNALTPGPSPAARARGAQKPVPGLPDVVGVVLVLFCPSEPSAGSRGGV